MNGRYIEPRQVMWAVAEILWEDDLGTSFRVPGILEDTSKSGACIRLKRPLAIGSRLIIKWHREQFSATARNCRCDGGDFLLGVRRETEMPVRKVEGPDAPSSPTKQTVGDSKIENTPIATPMKTAAFSVPPRISASPTPAPPPERVRVAGAGIADSHAQTTNQIQGTLHRPERKAMEPKTIFPHFWRRKPDCAGQDENAPAKPTRMEVSVNNPSAPEATASGPRGELLGYEDIYRAAGIMSPGSGYDIHKVVDMLNSERLRDLSPEAKRASVLMALDAAAISADDLLTDATRRQNALTSYESSQVKQLADFEARKAKENSKIEEELEKIRVHYGQRIQSNLDQVAKEKDALRTWQMAMQHEPQRIAEVIELCGKHPAPVAKANAVGAAAGAHGEKSSSAAPSGTASTGRSPMGGN